jgi:hypothetical protein
MGGILKRNSVVTAIRRHTNTRSKTPRRQDKTPVEQPPCAICQEPVGVTSPDGVTEGWSTLSCGHTFGSVCIKKWLGMVDRPCCPMCREDVAHSCGHAVLPQIDPEPERTQLRSEKRWSSMKSGASGEGWKQRLPRDDPRKMECGFCSASPRMRTRLRTRIIIKMIRLVLKSTRQRRHVQSMDNWQRAQVILRQAEVREEWEDWWDAQEPKTDRERDGSTSSSSSSNTALANADTVEGDLEIRVVRSSVTHSVVLEPPSRPSMSGASGTTRAGRAASF